MNLSDLVQEISQQAQSYLKSLPNMRQPQRLGLRMSARLPILAVIYTKLKRPLVLLTDRTDRAILLHDELRQWLPEAPIFYFPEPNPLFYENAAWGDHTRRERLIALTHLAEYHIPDPTLRETHDHPGIIIASARAIMARTLPRREFLKASRPIRPGQVVRPEALVRKWVALGYEASNIVVRPAQFARRGGILDIWPIASTSPARLEFFGDEVDTLREFDPASQRTIGALQQIFVTPAREFILPPDAVDVTDPTEFLIPQYHTTPAGLLDYLPRSALVLVDHYPAFVDKIQEVEEQALRMRGEMVHEGQLDPNYPIPYLGLSEISDALTRHPLIELGPPGEETSANLAQLFSAGPRFGGRLKPFLEHLVEQVDSGVQLMIVSRQASRLQELWRQQRYALESGHLDQLSIVQGSLAEGWILQASGGDIIHLYTDGEIFGWRRPEPRQRHTVVAEAPEAPYADLRPGDFIVHIDHGIGCFVGLVNRTIDGLEREYLCIEYANEAQLFVPVHQADRISRYIGTSKRPPKLSRLGGIEWRNVKSHVKEAVVEVAEDLLNLYAERGIIQGHSFSSDTPWQQELEASFPYIETEDQLRVLSEVKQDMENSRPMDRLICGDVGYGKTEIALRAAFKAVMDGKQVAVLVPTTVLAQQHFHTFRQRLAAFPAEVEMLSRFRSPQQQKEILRRLASASIDIIIGTHRLLSEDVIFKDLGLLIIDEEQRFGVTHKEKLKKMRTEMDVLTLTATPIPRTLYMTLTGVRDISMITTPPEERLPIVTHVGPYSPRLVRQAILRELERGGQVFFVHNRVQTINAMQSHLQKLAPEARITIAHGQMHEKDLSDRMKRFSAGEVDVLLSTSIIESGLDIPNANTLIVDRADTFGLAQLYQLRGRVGRGAQRAYTYFFRHRRKSPTPEGRQRLDTLAENTQLGAGLSIAMRDLEIRGAGDILGTRQHGHIAAIGFHLYTRLLADAVQRLRQKSAKSIAIPGTVLSQQLGIPVNVELPLTAGIPSDYVPDKSMRLHLYRRLANIQETNEVEALYDEFSDRFGPPPQAVQNLFYQLKVKLLVGKAGLASVSNENGQIVFRYDDGLRPPTSANGIRGVRVGKTALWMAYGDLPDWKSHLVRVLEQLEVVAPIPLEREKT